VCIELFRSSVSLFKLIIFDRKSRRNRHSKTTRLRYSRTPNCTPVLQTVLPYSEPYILQTMVRTVLRHFKLYSRAEYGPVQPEIRFRIPEYSPQYGSEYGSEYGSTVWSPGVSESRSVDSPLIRSFWLSLHSGC